MSLDLNAQAGLSQQLSCNHKKWHLVHAEPSDAIFDVLVANRQIDHLDSFLKPDFETDLHDPFLMPDMEKVVEMLRRIRAAQLKVMIVGDYDADGITGTAMLYETFQALGIQQIICRLPHRIHDGYGFQPHIIAEAVRDRVDVIFTVDNGVSSLEAITLAKQHGIAVVICDHHTLPEVLPPADAILHPKMPDGGYPFKDLTGVGVAYKLAQAVCPRMMPSKDAERFLKWSLDLVAIGTVADCATVMGENRVLIKYGLIVIEKTRRPGLRNILNLCAGKNPVYDATLIGFRIAPRINAAGRISHPDTSLKLLTTQNVVEADLLAKELQDLNTRRQEKTQAAVDEALAQLQTELAHEKILIARNKDWHPGIVGLIAGRLTEEYQRPAVIFHENERGVLVASARSTEYFNIVQAIAQQKDLLIRFGGHAQAAGCSLEQENYAQFSAQMKALANAALSDEQLAATLNIDCELRPEQITPMLKKQLDLLEPYGIGNTRPLFLLRNLQIQQANAVGSHQAHLQLWFQTAGRTLKGIGFQQGHLAAQLTVGERVDVVCHLQENTWNGLTSLELEVVDMSRTCEQPCSHTHP